MEKQNQGWTKNGQQQEPLTTGRHMDDRRFDARQSVTNGRGPIVLRVENGYAFHEHGTIGQAKAEAARLVATLGGTCVVYVPVALVELPPKVVVTSLLPNSNALEDDDLPF